MLPLKTEHAWRNHAGFLRKCQRVQRIWWLRWGITGLVLLLPAVVFLMPVFALPFAEEGTSRAETYLPTIAPDTYSQQQYKRDVEKATQAEIDRLGTMAFVLSPYPHSMPIMIGRLPQTEAINQESVNRFIAAFRRTGCVDAESQVNKRADFDAKRLGDAEQQLRDMNPGARGLPLLFEHYHAGLIAMCRGDFNSAHQAFASVRRTIDDQNLEDSSLVQQFRFVGIAGERDAAAQTEGRVLASTLPDLPETPAVFEQGICTEASSESCRLFGWPARRTDLARTIEFLITPDADPQSYRAALNSADDGRFSITSYNLANTVVAHAKAGDFVRARQMAEAIDERLSRSAGTAEFTCQERARIANIGWIAGSPAENLTPCGSRLPDANGLIGGDSERIKAWEKINTARKNLETGDLATFSATLANEEVLPDDEQAFLANVRRELVGLVSSRLFVRLDDAKASGDLETRDQVLALLGSDIFPTSTRALAALEKFWGGWRGALAITIGIALTLLLSWLAVMRMMIGYSLSFTQRHYLERQANKG